jgi:protein-L-isoaspartate(D-aspartate) O-methyltransferase
VSVGPDVPRGDFVYRSLKSPLRPAYATFFPRFNDAELLSRAARLEPHLVTLLDPRNIRRLNALAGDEWFNDYLRLEPSRKAHLLGDVLRHVGIPGGVVRAMTAIRRDSFVPERYRPLAYLNWSVPLGRGSALSAPGIVALYCSSLPAALPAGRVVEVGSGSGYHLAVLANRYPDVELLGYEAVATIAACSCRWLKASGLGERIRIVADVLEDGKALERASVGLLYRTHASRSLTPLDWHDSLVEGAIQQGVRPLTADEFDQSASDTWLREQFPTYQAYRRAGWYTSCALVTVRMQAREARVMRTYYNVTFVPERRGAIAEPGDGVPGYLDFLMSEAGQVYGS